MSLGKRLAAGAACAALALVAGTAIASTNSIDDPTGDVSGNPAGSVSKHDVDITKASGGMVGTKVELTVHVDGSIGQALGSFATSPGFVLKNPGAAHAGYDVYDSRGKGYTAESYKTGDSTPATLSRPNGHKAVITFKPGPIGLPDTFKWYAVTGVCAPFDSAPNSGFASSKVTKRC